ncbi:MAG: DUF1631 domain-containing protein [Cellvibrionaceae bacterium]
MSTNSGNAKVIPLHSDRSRNAQSDAVMKAAIRDGIARLPQPVQQVHGVAQSHFKASIQNLFDHVDDALFELADRATSNLEQNVFFESMREVRIQRRSMEKSFIYQIDQNFAALLADNVEISSPAYHNQSATDEFGTGGVDLDTDDLSLVSKDELEELVAIDSLVSKSWAKNKSALRGVSLRMASLLPSEISEKNNPFSPRLLADSFVEASNKIDVDIKAKLVLFKLFERYVMNDLASVLNEVNRNLSEQGVPVPSTRSRGVAPVKQKRPAPAMPTPPMVTNASMQVPSSSPSDIDMPEPSVDNVATGLYATLQSLLKPQAASTAPQSNFSETSYVGSVQEGYSVDEISYGLLAALSQLQQQQLQEAPISESLREGQAQLLTSEHIQSAIQSATGEELVDERSEDVMKLVDMLFSYILEDNSLPDPVKLLLSRLQIPFIKVAIADDEFFKKEGHPARRLLNEMATASIGWAGDVNSEKRDPLLSKIESIVSKVLEEFESNFELFTLLLTDFIAFQEKERRRAMLFEKRAIDAEDGKAKAEIGRQKVDAQLGRLITGRELPEAFISFVQGPWSNILFLIYMRQGENSKQWQNAFNVAKELVWSALPIKSDKHEAKLVSLLPRLQVSIKKGLESISFNPAKQARFIDKFTAHHEVLLDQYRNPPVIVEEAVDVNEALHLSEERVAEESTPEEQVLEENVAVKEGDQTLSQEQDQPVANTAPQLEEPLNKSNINEAQVVEEPVVSTTPVANEPILKAEQETVPEEPQKQEQALVQPTEEPIKVDAQYVNLVDNFTVGVWFEKIDQGATAYRCRLAAIIRGTGKYIFVNRAGVKVAEETRDTLALQLQAGQLRTLDDGMLFDRALESVITNLRKTR